MRASIVEEYGEDIDELARMVQRARRVVAFTGAGVSTECGIPDFRSPGGFWTTFKPIAFEEFLASEERRLEAWRRFFAIREKFGGALPGRGHRAIRALADVGKITHVITQNIDDLHRLSGVPAERIIELHGNGTYAKCLACETTVALDWVKTRLAETGRAPTCDDCAGLIKAATISFGQPMPEDAMARARAATLNANLFLAIGSSLQVAPAMGFPVLAKQNRAALVILNREPTGLDGLADLVINGDIGDVMSAFIAKLEMGTESLAHQNHS